MLPEVESLAAQVRERVAEWVERAPSIEPDLGGACAIASYALWRVLRARGFPAVFVFQADSELAHCWVELNGYVVDITATQFGGPPIAIFRVGEKPDWWEDLDDLPHRSINQEAMRRVSKWKEQSPQKYHAKVERLVGRLQSEATER
jgi:hypothetical protein